ncbi:hypothetical protein CH372_19290 [Leptospira meyeri]|uniref:hypothetical protein n=1 Tax=Leptospira meyeri TaxID=29508 RepID=UPI000C2ACE53|nr:hypothetical protein [Leptospira meyeri]PKA10453.1 hypothetical protein CH372_19290 [Leptospira meyeri]
MKIFLLFSLVSIYSCSQHNLENKEILIRLDEKNVLKFLSNKQIIPNASDYKIFDFLETSLPNSNRTILEGKIVDLNDFNFDCYYFIIIVAEVKKQYEPLFVFHNENAKILTYDLIDINNDEHKDLSIFYDISGNGYTQSFVEIYEGSLYQKIFEAPILYSANFVKFNNKINLIKKGNNAIDLNLTSLYNRKSCDIFSGNECKNLTEYTFRFSMKKGKYALTNPKDFKIYNDFILNAF